MDWEAEEHWELYFSSNNSFTKRYGLSGSIVQFFSGIIDFYGRSIPKHLIRYTI